MGMFTMRKPVSYTHLNSDGEFPEEVFSILNNREGYETLYKRICSCLLYTSLTANGSQLSAIIPFPKD